MSGIERRGRTGPVVPAEARVDRGRNGLPRAQPSTDQNGQPDITFTLTTEAGDRFYKYTYGECEHGQMAIVLDNKVREVANIESAIRDQRRDSRRIHAGAGGRPEPDAAHGIAAGVDLVPGDEYGWAVAGQAEHSPGRGGGDCRHGWR